jgi:transcriptional regulator with XRE-family HTH domain
VAHMVDFYEYSTPELVRLLGNRFKEYRIRCNLTQKDISEQSGIGLTTIHKFENGTAGNILLSTFIVLLKVVGQISGLEEFDYYLIKLGNSQYSSAELEMSYYELATMAGINMMPFSSNSYNTEL